MGESVVGLQHIVAKMMTHPCFRFGCSAQYVFHFAGATGMRGEAMDELIARIISNVGIERPVGGTRCGDHSRFSATEGPADKVQELIARLPGAAEAAAAAHADGGGGLFGGMGGIMGVGSRLMSAGLGMGEIQGVTHEIIALAREKAGDEDLDAIVEAIPGLSQYV